MILSPSQMQDLLAELLEGAAGNTRDHWRRAIGELEQLPTRFHVRSNWRVRPRGRKRDLEAVEQAVEVARQKHPYVA